jgi:hypothetical protein
MTKNEIVLTPEILQKCGFIWDESIEHWVLDTGRESIHFFEKDGRLMCFLVVFGQMHYKAIDHLHQLQNFYFAHFGEELEVSI